MTAGRVALAWQGKTHAYRVRVRNGTATIERSHAGRGPWRRMPYAQEIVDKMAELAAGRQWREMPLQDGEAW